MKFEQVLQIYWTKGFLLGGQILPFTVTSGQLVTKTYGIGLKRYKLILNRFELTCYHYNKTLPFSFLDKEVTRSMNRVFSKITSINYPILDLTRLNLLRLYLVRSYRGKAHALGKPSRGQRTWSNAWNSYLCNKITRHFIVESQRKLQGEKKTEKINYKMVKKLAQQKKTDTKKKNTLKKKNIWF